VRAREGEEVVSAQRAELPRQAVAPRPGNEHTRTRPRRAERVSWWQRTGASAWKSGVVSGVVSGARDRVPCCCSHHAPALPLPVALVAYAPDRKLGGGEAQQEPATAAPPHQLNATPPQPTQAPIISTGPWLVCHSLEEAVDGAALGRVVHGERLAPAGRHLQLQLRGRHLETAILAAIY
jgi:hypothetical protein